MQAEKRPPEPDEKWLEEVLTPLNGLENVLFEKVDTLSKPSLPRYIVPLSRLAVAPSSK